MRILPINTYQKNNYTIQNKKTATVNFGTNPLRYVPEPPEVQKILQEVPKILEEAQRILKEAIGLKERVAKGDTEHLLLYGKDCISYLQDDWQVNFFFTKSLEGPLDEYTITKLVNDRGVNITHSKCALNFKLDKNGQNRLRFYYPEETPKTSYRVDFNENGEVINIRTHSLWYGTDTPIKNGKPDTTVARNKLDIDDAHDYPDD